MPRHALMGVLEIIFIKNVDRVIRISLPCNKIVKTTILDGSEKLLNSCQALIIRERF